MSIDDMIAVLQAAKAGKKTQISSRSDNPRKWFDMNLPCNHMFNFVTYDYRVRPEPRTIWVNEYSHADTMTAHSSRDRAVSMTQGYSPNRLAVKFVEVIE